MVVSTKDIYDLCCVIAQQESLEVCITEACKAGLITGGITFIMAAALGPIAIVPSAAVGGLVANHLTKKYVPVWKILADMSVADQMKLCHHIQNIVRKLEIADAVALVAIASAPQSPPYRQILRGMGTHFNQQWGQD